LLRVEASSAGRCSPTSAASAASKTACAAGRSPPCQRASPSWFEASTARSGSPSDRHAAAQRLFGLLQLGQAPRHLAGAVVGAGGLTRFVERAPELGGAPPLSGGPARGLRVVPPEGHSGVAHRPFRCEAPPVPLALRGQGLEAQPVAAGGALVGLGAHHHVPDRFLGRLEEQRFDAVAVQRAVAEQAAGLAAGRYRQQLDAHAELLDGDEPGAGGELGAVAMLLAAAQRLVPHLAGAEPALVDARALRRRPSRHRRAGS
jgi:hypothetical protein